MNLVISGTVNQTEIMPKLLWSLRESLLHTIQHVAKFLCHWYKQSGWGSKTPMILFCSSSSTGLSRGSFKMNFRLKQLSTHACRKSTDISLASTMCQALCQRLQSPKTKPSSQALGACSQSHKYTIVNNDNVWPQWRKKDKESDWI